MKIAMFADCYLPIINGVVTSLVELKQGLEALGHKVYVFAPSVPKYKETDPKVFRFSSFSFPFQKEERVALPFSARIYGKIIRLRLDIAHIHTPFNLGFAGLYVAQALNLPLVFTHHTLWEEYVHYIPFLPKEALKRVAVELCKYFCEKAAAVIAPSQDVANMLISYGVKTPIEVIPTGVQVELFQGADGARVRRLYNLKPEEKLLLFVGRLGKEKSVDFLLRAFKLISSSLADTKFMLVGDGPERRSLEQYALKLGISDKVIFCGYINRDELKDYYAAADLFIYASITETQGLVILEAMLCGTPVVAVDASGFRDLIENGVQGFLVPQNEEEFCAEVLKVLQDQELYQKLKAASKHKGQSFSTRSFAGKVSELYARLDRLW
jgi:1,2-diacylglycerol 3-alpha-glucosyltransferase